MTPKPTPSLISKIDCSRAIETFLAAGMVWSPDAPTDPTAITDAYYFALNDFTKDQLVAGIQRIIRDTRNDALPWIPAANKVRWAIEQIDRAAAPALARPKARVTVYRIVGFDDLGPLIRNFAEGEHADLPLPEATRCPLAGCGCEAVDVWIPAASFGGMTRGWGARWVWAHVALAQSLKRVADGLPFERAR